MCVPATAEPKENLLKEAESDCFVFLLRFATSGSLSFPCFFFLVMWGVEDFRSATATKQWRPSDEWPQDRSRKNGVRVNDERAR